MKLAITCDLHLPKTPADTIIKLVADIAAENPDAIILAGDIGESSSDTASCVSLFRPIQCPVLVIAGNHDLLPIRTTASGAGKKSLRRHAHADPERANPSQAR